MTACELNKIEYHNNDHHHERVNDGLFIQLKRHIFMIEFRTRFDKLLLHKRLYNFASMMAKSMMPNIPKGLDNKETKIRLVRR